jgi:integrase
MPTTKLLLQQPYKKGSGKILNPLETRLYLFLIVDRSNKVKIKTEHVIYPHEWDFRNQQKKEIKGSLAGTPEENKKIQNFNDDLRKLKKDILDKYNDLRKKFPDMPFSQVAQALKDYGKTKENPYLDVDKDFFQVFDEFLLSLEEEASPRTIQKFGTLKNSLLELGKVNEKYKTLSFSMINKSFLTTYTNHLRNQKPRGRQKTRPEDKQYGLLNDTVGKYVECLKTFLKWAEEYPSEENRYNKFTAYKKFSNSGTKREKKAEDIVTLTLSELRQFYTYDFSDRPSLERVRDLFCFGAFTGQRWSDIERLDKSEIHSDVWSFNAYKTRKDTEIYLTGYAASALDILKKYSFDLPKISLQKFNLYLKNAAKAAGINTPVTVRRYIGRKEIKIVKPKYAFLGSHAGRRTCVSILLNEFNMNISHVKEITGHSDLDSLQKYVNSDNQARRKAMSQTKSILEPLTVVKEKAG